MKLSQCLFALAAVATLALAPRVSFGQAVGIVSGRTVGKDGKPAPNAAIRAVAEGATTSAANRFQITSRAVSNQDGYFTLRDLPTTGKVTIVATWYAFDGSSQRGLSKPIEVQANKEIRLPEENIQLVDGVIPVVPGITPGRNGGPGGGGPGRGGGRGGGPGRGPGQPPVGGG